MRLEVYPNGFVRLICACFVLCSIPSAKAAAVSAAFEEQLTAEFKASPVGADGNLQVDQGTILVVRKAGIFGIPQGTTPIPPSVYKDGIVHQPGKMIQILAGGAQTAKLLRPGEQVYLVKISVDVKGDKITFFVVECDACNRVTAPSLYRAAVEIQFLPKGFLRTADYAQVKDVVNPLFSLGPEKNSQSSHSASIEGVYVIAQDTSSRLQLNGDGSFSLNQNGRSYTGSFSTNGDRLLLTVSGRSFAAGMIQGETIIGPDRQVWTREDAVLAPIPPPPPPPDEPQGPPPTVSLGLTIDQVVVILGQPATVADLGSKKIYSYKNLKVTFIDGKVTDIQ